MPVARTLMSRTDEGLCVLCMRACAGVRVLMCAYTSIVYARTNSYTHACLRERDCNVCVCIRIMHACTHAGRHILPRCTVCCRKQPFGGDVYTHTYIHRYMHRYIQRYIHRCMNRYIHVNIHTYIHSFNHSYIHTYIHHKGHSSIYTYHTCI
jgi:hypothetical protein